MKPGPLNLITDVEGLTVGNCCDVTLKSGVTTLLCETENVSSVHVMGGAPGTRDTDLLQPENIVQSTDALVLSGGSAFGLDAASGVQSALREQGKGFAVEDQRIPIVPTAILFDLINGGNKDWGKHSPYRELGYNSVKAANREFELGSVGAGSGALVGGPEIGLKGGLGSASIVLDNGITVAALVAVNALGAPTVGLDKHFWAAPFEQGSEFGGHGISNAPREESRQVRIKFRERHSQGANTTIGIIATDAALNKAQAKRLAVAAHDGFARALWPAHTPLDGDLIFAISTGTSKIEPALDTQIDLSAAAAGTMSRAIARGIFSAAEMPNDIFPTWKNYFNT
ncbi:MAG: P1 family peptidase [Rhizobiaceae bacterium]